MNEILIWLGKGCPYSCWRLVGCRSNCMGRSNQSGTPDSVSLCHSRTCPLGRLSVGATRTATRAVCAPRRAGPPTAEDLHTPLVWVNTLVNSSRWLWRVRGSEEKAQAVLTPGSWSRGNAVPMCHLFLSSDGTTWREEGSRVI